MPSMLIGNGHAIVWNRDRAPAQPADDTYPPFDVAFVWHGYMIRTDVFWDDLQMLFPGTETF